MSSRRLVIALGMTAALFLTILALLAVQMGLGDDPVVDKTLKVRGVQKLRVADASIMPRLVSGNTNAPVIMIGEKASDLILAEHGT